MPRPSPNTNLSSMLFSPGSPSDSLISLSCSGLSSSFSKPSLSDPSTPTPAKNIVSGQMYILVAYIESTKTKNSQLFNLPVSESGKHGKLGFGLELCFCPVCESLGLVWEGRPSIEAPLLDGM